MSRRARERAEQNAAKARAEKRRRETNAAAERLREATASGDTEAIRVAGMELVRLMEGER